MTGNLHLIRDNKASDYQAALLLSTKLIPPMNQPSLVHRQRLFDLFDGQPLPPLTLICAPAGFGKTTLLIAQLEQQTYPVAWVSLDQNDNDAVQLLRYLIAAVQKHHPELGQKETVALSSPQTSNILPVLRSLINQLSQLEQPLLLVLDDYHDINQPACHEIINYLIEHRPHHLHLAITSRAEPPFPLSRLRVRRQLLEITEQDLRFTRQEAGEFLNQISKLQLTADDISILETRTEGWIAGLQLAAISLNDEEDKALFIQTFAGDDNYITDYLTDEVLKRQPEEIRDFLLETSILSKLTPALCDAITGRQNSAVILEKLEKAKLFLIPLDNKRHWYRYHHLFADLLREQLIQTNPTQLAPLHRAASQWLSAHEQPHEAMQHAFATDDFEQASNILLTHGQQLFDDGQTITLKTWYQRLPVATIKQNPEHMLRFIWSCFLASGEFQDNLFDELKRQIQTGLFVEEDHLCGAVQHDLTLMKGFRAIQQRHILSAQNYARQAMEYRPSTLEPSALPSHMLYATTNLTLGQLDEAEAQYGQLIESAFNNEYLITLNASICGLSFVRIQKMAFQVAKKQLENDLQRLKKLGWDEYLIDSAWIYLALSEIAYLTDELEKSRQYLDSACITANMDEWQTLPAMINVRFAKIYLAQGNTEKADEYITPLNNCHIEPSLLPFISDVRDDLLLLKLRRGDHSAIDPWLTQTQINTQGLTDSETLNQQLLRLRIFIIRHQTEQAIKLVTHLLTNVVKPQQKRIMIDLLILQALARQALGQTHQAIEPLKSALTLAAAENCIRPFIDEGEPLLVLLKHLLKNPQTAFVECVFEKMNSQKRPSLNGAHSIEPLSQKEQQTLDLLVTGLANKEIAEQLFVSTNTVKTHLKSIYQKMNVKDSKMNF